MAKAFLKPAQREELVCKPPAGAYDKDSPVLHWVERKYGKTSYLSVFIPTHTFENFLEGETQRTGCTFIRQRSDAKKSSSKKGKASTTEDLEEGEDQGEGEDQDTARACASHEKDQPEIGEDDAEGNEGQERQYKMSAVCEKITMHCCRGPQDKRSTTAKAVPKQANKRIDRTGMGLSIKVGCPAHFSARVQPDTRHITELLYYEHEHSEACKALPRLHRISDKLRREVLVQLQLGIPARDIMKRNRDHHIAQHMAANNISDRGQAIRSLQGNQLSRDFHLSLVDIANIRRTADRQTWMLDPNPQQSVLLWAEQNQESVLYVREQKPIEGTPDFEVCQQQAAAKRREGALKRQAQKAACMLSIDDEGGETEDGKEEADARPHEVDAVEPAFVGANDEPNLEQVTAPEQINMDRSDGHAAALPTPPPGTDFQFNPLNWEAFAIAIMQPRNIEDAVKWGHGKWLQLDSTFGSNAQKFPLFTLLAVDKHHHGVPIAYLICSQERVELVEEFLKAVATAVQKVKADWSPKGILVDACAAEIAAVDGAFHGRVETFLCHWHVQRAWKKQLFTKVAPHNVEPIFRDLLRIMRKSSPVGPALSLEEAKKIAAAEAEEFCQKWTEKKEKKFVDYFKQEWQPKLRMIMQLFRDRVGCAINTTSHIEGWHRTLKGTFLTGRRRLINRRIDWLLCQLTTEVMEEFILRTISQEDGMANNTRAYDAIRKAIIAAGAQPNNAVTAVDASRYSVRSATAADRVYEVNLPQDGVSEASCSCQAGHFGNMCWHLAKVLLLHGASEFSLLRHLGLLWGSSNGGYQKIREAMEAEASQVVHRDPAEADPPDHGENDEALAMVEPDPSAAASEAAPWVVAAQEASSSAGGSEASRAKDEALTAVARLLAPSEDWPECSQNWKWLKIAANIGYDELQKMTCRSSIASLEKSSSCPAFQQNPDAPAGNSLKRGRSWLERAGDANRRAANSSSSGAAYPFLRPPSNPKLPSVLKEIQAKGQHSKGNAATQSLQRASSAPEALQGGSNGSDVSAPSASALPSRDAANLRAMRGKSRLARASTAGRGDEEEPPPPSSMQHLQDEGRGQGGGTTAVAATSRLSRRAPRPSRYQDGAQ